ncbi:hypothetical protein [Streptomyces albipurpureus]|uniref:Uncharacterized protein n=1 Tax=Streptomyces albipurpureus TaxID=2897419 RepID=A0ABT0UY68_9ACTN|nr:hypothetical protein [Streptomyces sp. CWNU-1]MCM2393201.1 hypothetical protein [Streptomyces sp. CWNU-1]
MAVTYHPENPGSAARASTVGHSCRTVALTVFATSPAVFSVVVLGLLPHLLSAPRRLLRVLVGS